MERRERYKELVKRRKVCDACYFKTKKKVLYNGSELDFNKGISDTDEIGQWSAWHGNLDADIMVIGQDWGDKDFYINFKNSNTGNFEIDSKTNRNLRELFTYIDPDIDIFSNSNKVGLFFTNSILCYKEGKMADPTSGSHHRICSNLYLLDLIDIVQPKIIIPLGLKAFQGLLSCSFIGLNSAIKNLKYKEAVDNSPYNIEVNNKKIFVFPVFHPGPLGLANRSYDNQKKDWENIRKKILELSIL